MIIPENWQEFELIDAGEGEKLERWGEFILRRPDPQAIWKKDPAISSMWQNPDLFYHRSDKGGGYWEVKSNKAKNTPMWNIVYRDLMFNIKPTSFKHTGLFPEQAVNWEWAMKKITEAKNPVNVLNLFAYTGGATVACAKAGAHVTHIDASKGMNGIAKENTVLSKIPENLTRFIQDDAVKFVEREIRRGKKYDAIIMDPPVYGRGPTGQLWQIEEDLRKLVNLCTQILTEKPLFFLINAYATEFSSVAIENILRDEIKKDGVYSSGEIGLKTTSRGFVLPCGLFARWESN